MTNEIQAVLAKDNVKERFAQLLGPERMQGFLSSLLQVVKSNNLLSKADPATILNAAATAAVLDLPLSDSLGFAWIVPFNDRRNKRVVAQFQIGWRGYIQLAHRTGQYRKINVVEVHENQFISWDALAEELDADLTTPGNGKVVGYAAYFVLVNGFSKVAYWTHQQLIDHAQEYSQSYRSGAAIWRDKFTEMACKTVLKNTLAKWGPLNSGLQMAVQADSAIQVEQGEYTYTDNPRTKGIDYDRTDFNKEKARLLAYIENAQDIEALDKVAQYVDKYDVETEFHNRYTTLTNE